MTTALTPSNCVYGYYLSTLKFNNTKSIFDLHSKAKFYLYIFPS